MRFYFISLRTVPYRYYMSPEIFANRRYNEASDMWAVGCMIYELTTAKPPFQASDIKGKYLY